MVTYNCRFRDNKRDNKVQNKSKDTDTVAKDGKERR